MIRPQQQEQASLKKISVFISAFVVSRKNYSISNCYILNSKCTTHVYNNLKRFKFERRATEEEHIITGLRSYPIKAFSTVNITIQALSGPQKITLLDVAFVSRFYTNTVSFNRFYKKGVHLNTENLRL
jgi:hypothetical protein